MLDATTTASIAAQPAPAANALDRLVARISPQAAALAVFTAIMAAVFAAIMWRTGGHFGYTLDDPYIHLALAERLAMGHYGINLGEVTSPSSSVIWPFLLIPGAGTALHPYMPLLLNFACGAASAVLFGRFARDLPLPADERATPYVRIAVAILLILATNQIGLAYTGMEHNLQVLVAIAAAIGLIDYLRGRRIPAWAVAAAAIGPSVRYEMLAITAAVALVLLTQRDWRRLTALSLGCLVLPLALSTFLLANGNLALPNSVMLKLSAISRPDALPFPLNIVIPKHWHSSIEPKIVSWAMLIAVAGIGWAARGRTRVFCGAVLTAGALHMLFGQFGWFYRYEVYFVAFAALATLWLAAERVPQFLVFIALPIAALYTTPLMKSAAAAQNIYEQQFQMHRFVSEHYRKPFAVNDLGWVSYRIDPKVYVLDLWGLASNEALVMARTRKPDWLDDITRRHGTGLAMVYSEWFPNLPVSWTKVGDLKLSMPGITPASDSVKFYATAVGDSAEIIRHLEAFRQTLPRGVTLEISGR